jgi:hypothetical protein
VLAATVDPPINKIQSVNQTPMAATSTQGSAPRLTPDQRIVNVSSVVNNLVIQKGNGIVQDAQGLTSSKVKTDADGRITYVKNSAVANYPDPDLSDLGNDAWRFKTTSNATLVVATGSTDDVTMSNTAVSTSKLAPAIAMGGTNVLTAGGGKVFTDVAATSRPGLQFGATVAKADQYVQSTANDAATTPDGFLAGATRSRATSGQGVTVALSRNVMRSNVGGTVSDVRANANSARWYMSPGTAVAGAANVGYSGRVYQYTQGRARASLGTANTGVLNYGIANGATPLSIKLIPNNIYSEIDQKANSDLGAANAGV